MTNKTLSRFSYQPSVKPFLREPPTEEELTEHVEVKRKLNKKQQMTVDVLYQVFKEKSLSYSPGNK